MDGVPGARWRVVLYTSPSGESPPREFISDQETKGRRRIAWVIELLEQHGPRLTRPYSDTVRGAIRELRVQSGRVAYRLLYGYIGGVPVILEAFIKKQNRIPRTHLELAEQRLTDMTKWVAEGRVML